MADLFNIAQWAEIAGSRIGLGDYRPQRGGLFGRFEAKVADRNRGLPHGGNKEGHGIARQGVARGPVRWRHMDRAPCLAVAKKSRYPINHRFGVVWSWDCRAVRLVSARRGGMVASPSFEANLGGFKCVMH